MAADAKAAAAAAPASAATAKAPVQFVRAPMTTLSLRLAPGEVLKTALQELAVAAGGRAYCIVTCVGSVRDIKIRTANSETVLHITTPHEITSLVGTWNAASGGHWHVTLSDSNGHCVGGHLMDGGTAFTTIELVVGEVQGVSYDRVYCCKSGYDELQPKRTTEPVPAPALAGAGAGAGVGAAAPANTGADPLAVDGVTAAQIIAHYALDGHEEGGYYKRIYAADFNLNAELPPAYHNAALTPDAVAAGNRAPKGTYKVAPEMARAAGSAIYYMLTRGQVSKLHLLKADECWQFLLGERLTVVELDPVTRREHLTVLGRDILNGEKLFHTVKAGRWFGAYANPGTRFGLVSCTLCPAWHPHDFAFASRKQLYADYPLVPPHLILRLTDDDTAPHGAAAAAATAGAAAATPQPKALPAPAPAATAGK